MIHYQALIKKERTGYSISFPDLAGCYSSASTLKEAKEMASEALSLYLEEARDPKWEIPKAKMYQGKNYYWIYPSFDISIAIIIRKARLRNGYTQAELAKNIGISTQQLQKLETPGKSNPTVKTLAAISKALNEKLDIQIAS